MPLIAPSIETCRVWGRRVGFRRSDGAGAVVTEGSFMTTDRLPATAPADALEGALPALVAARAQAALARAEEYARTADAPNTLRAYRADWAHYAAWCDVHGFVPVPAEPATVGAYLASMATTHKPATLRRRLAAIGKMHRFNSLPWNASDRAIQQPLRGVLREHGQAPRQARALSLAHLRAMLQTCDLSARGRRDRLLLLLGFSGALRRSELVGLQVADVVVSEAGLALSIARSKTDAAGSGVTLGLPRGSHPQTCPVLAFRSWQAVAVRQTGPLLRRISVAGRIADTALRPFAVQRILTTRAEAASVPLDQLSPHALRVGFITEAYDRGIRDEDIMAHTRHKDLRTMRGYVRRAGLISDSPAGLLGL